MSYRTKKDVLSSISTRRKRRNGAEYTIHDAYLGYDPYTGKQMRMQSSDLAELKARIERFYVEYRAGGDAAARLKPHEATDAREAIDLLAAHGKRLSLAEVVRSWIDGSDTPAETSGSVEKAQEESGKTLGEAYDAFMKSLIGRSQVYERTLKSRLGAFVDEFGRETDLDGITAGAVVKSLEGRLLDRNDDRTWKTYNNHLGDIKTFFGWCAKSTQRYIKASPVAEVESSSSRTTTRNTSRPRTSAGCSGPSSGIPASTPQTSQTPSSRSSAGCGSARSRASATGRSRPRSCSTRRSPSSGSWRSRVPREASDRA